MTISQGGFSQTEEEAVEEVYRLMKNYELDMDTAVRVQDVMRLKGVDADSAVELTKEKDNGAV